MVASSAEAGFLILRVKTDNLSDNKKAASGEGSG